MIARSGLHSKSELHCQVTYTLDNIRSKKDFVDCAFEQRKVVIGSKYTIKSMFHGFAIREKAKTDERESNNEELTSDDYIPMR